MLDSSFFFINNPVTFPELRTFLVLCLPNFHPGEVLHHICLSTELYERLQGELKESMNP